MWTRPHITAASLMAKIMEMMGFFSRDIIVRTNRRSRGRIKALVEAGSS
jgi:hypothetical protein